MDTRDTRDPKAQIAAVQTPTVGEAGKTKSWRTFKPVIDNDKCILVKSDKAKCWFCWLYCPEAAIERTKPPKIKDDYCKGCGICANECPHDAIKMEEE